MSRHLLRTLAIGSVAGLLSIPAECCRWLFRGSLRLRHWGARGPFGRPA